MSRMLETTTIDLLRHAECEGGAIFRGSLDVALSEQGWQRLRTVAAGRDGWQHVISSPMQRCHAFAQELAQQRDLPLTTDTRLQEMSFGNWEGVPVAEVWEQQVGAATAWLEDPDSNPPPGGEPLSVLHERVQEALAVCLQSFRGQHVLVVTHGGVMRALISQALNMPSAAMNQLDLPWACLSRLSYTHSDEGDFARLMGHNMAGS